MRGMRALYSTLALVAILAGLGAYSYFVASKQDTDSSTTKQEKVFADLASDKVSELTVKSESGDVTSLKKGDDGKWQMTAPLATRGADADITGVASALSSLEITRVVDENPANLKEFGLDAPKMQIDFKSSDGKSGKLQIGEKNATGASLYAKKNDEKRVFLIAQYQETSLNKSTFDLRDKSIMALDHDKIDGIEVNLEGGKTMQLSKSGALWKMNKPVAARADFSAVEGLLGRVETAQMKAIASDQATPADLKKYGLDKPAVTVNLTMGSAHAAFLVGGKAEEETIYAKDASKPTVVTVEKSLGEDLKKVADDYRQHGVFEMRAFSATHVEITKGSQKLVFDRVKGQGENGADKWHRVNPTAGDADKEKTDKMLADIADINVTTFLDSTAKTGLESPALVVDVKFNDGTKEEKVTFGKNGNDVFVSRPDEPGAMKVDAEKFNEVVKELDELLK